MAEQIMVTTRDGRFDILHPDDVSQSVRIWHPKLQGGEIGVIANEGDWDANTQWWGDIVRGALGAYIQRYVSSRTPQARAFLALMDEDETIEEEFNAAFAQRRVRSIDAQVARLQAERERLVRTVGYQEPAEVPS